MKKCNVAIQLLLLGVIFFSCNKNSQNKLENNADSISLKKEKPQDIPPVENKHAAPIAEKDLPKLENKEASAFILKVKNYYQEMEKANQSNQIDKIMELQKQAPELVAEYQKISDKLNPEEKKELQKWYMKLVAAAAE